MSSRSLVGVLLSVAAASTVIAGPCAAQQLGSLAIRPDRIFVAGISAGGYMAVQMHVAFSHLFKGAAIYAGGPYDCAQGSLATALSTCLSDEPPVDLATLESTTASWASQGLIDPVADLKGQPVYLWSGAADTTVRQPLMDALKSYYQSFQAFVFQYDNNFNAQHGWESPYGPLPCPEATTPYIIKCSTTDQSASGVAGGATGLPSFGNGSSAWLTPWFTNLNPTGSSSLGQSSAATGQSWLGQSSAATGLSSLGQSSAAAGPYDSEKVWLTQWFGNLNPKNEGTLNGAVISFDQNEFAPGGNAAAISMDQTGYAFVPVECANGEQCGVILALHGCLQYHGAVGSAFIDDAGINQWADTNHIVVLYPQTIPTGDSNPQGCWDWWGYLNDSDYAQKTGPQMQALYAMVRRVAGVQAP
jgi:poly(3-hydroxybutyrate) depolymerase